MKRLALIALFCLLPTVVLAHSPVYLDCAVADENGGRYGIKDISLMVNSETRELALTVKRYSGETASFDVDGTFSPNEITFSWVESEEVRPMVTTMRNSYVLDRTDLSITVKQFKTVMDFVNHGEAQNFTSEETVSSGFCTIVEVKDRKL